MSTFLFQNPWTFWLPWRTDLFHSLAQRPAPFRFRKEIVTIHDVFPLVGRGYCADSFRRKFAPLIVQAAERADRIITPSQYTAEELVHHAGANRGKIRVIPWGVDFPEGAGARSDKSFDQASERRTWAEPGKKLVLVVGVVQTRKNTLGAVRAIERLPADYVMLLAGGDGYGSEPVHDYIRKNGLGKRARALGYVGRAEIRSLYRAADVLLFPSFEEGFGLPVLEAMACGLPVVASQTSALPEAAGDAALYADPNDVDGMAEKIREAAEDERLRHEMVRKGLLRAREFTWRRAALATLAVYDEALAE